MVKYNIDGHKYASDSIDFISDYIEKHKDEWQTCRTDEAQGYEFNPELGFRNAKTKRLIKPWKENTNKPDNETYWKVDLAIRAQKVYRVLVHEVLLSPDCPETWLQFRSLWDIKGSDGKSVVQVNHKDGDTSNNMLSNLMPASRPMHNKIDNARRKFERKFPKNGTISSEKSN